MNPVVWPFDRSRKARSGMGLVRAMHSLRPELIVMEGTGLAGGLAVLYLRERHGIPYIVSSGDAVGPYIAGRRPLLGPPAASYERLLCARSAGFVGWSPYLTGRALTFGAPRGMTASGWALHPPRPGDRGATRAQHGIPEEAIVLGIVGTLRWNARVGYCYGMELVRALERTSRDDLHVLIVGDGDGKQHITRLLDGDPGLRRRVTLTGAVPRARVPSYLAAMDVASLPQSADSVGLFRYTTKISEYLSAQLPIVTGQLPFAYDLDGGWLWRLPGAAPWDGRYLEALGALMGSLSARDVEQLKRAVPVDHPGFDLQRQQERTCAFVSEVLAEQGPG